MANKKPSKDYNAPIHFRPGLAYGESLSTYAKQWRVSRNEVARRLGLLALHGLNVHNYAAVARLADCLGGGQDFEHAAGRAHALLDGSDRTRLELGRPPLGERERIAYLEDWVAAQISGEPVPDSASQPTPATGATDPQPEPEFKRKFRLEEIQARREAEKQSDDGSDPQHGGDDVHATPDKLYPPH